MQIGGGVFNKKPKKKAESQSLKDNINNIQTEKIQKLQLMNVDTKH